VTDFAPLRRLGHWWSTEVVAGIDRAAVFAAVEEDARWSLRYGFMVIMSAGIAVLGLLQSSPAVVIGAMLISPLMGPIIGLGFALAVFDWRDVRRSIFALAAGAALAISFSALVVVVSPLQTVTAEILARTRPNLFDLLIAIFSALAGTYATIRGKGATIVGVAIATALMPPLATVGFGLATANPAIAYGALALFFTNLLAIALCAAIMARLFGFGTSLSKTQTRRQAILITLVFVGMAVPLALSLRQIAWESLATRNLRSAVTASFGDTGHISQFDIDFVSQPIRANAVVLTERFNTGAQAQAGEAARRILGPDARFLLEQVIVNQRSSRLESERAALAKAEASLKDAGEAAALAEALAGIAGRDPADVIIDLRSRQAVVQARATASLAELADRETRIAARYPSWSIKVLPPASLPMRIAFPAGDADAASQTDVEGILWALQRQDIRNVRVVGRAASTGDGNGNSRVLAEKRAGTIAMRLREAGVDATPEVDPIGPRQRAIEKQEGPAVMRSVEVLPAEDLAAAKAP
jgi:uncharacterized hydrophobic protein (TIGR00271 family)